MPNIREIPAQDEAWRSFCAQQTGLTLFSSPRWADALHRTYGFTMEVAAVFDGERIIGGLPYADITDFRGRRRVSMAFSDNVEPVAQSLWDELEAYIAKSGIPWNVRTRCTPTSLAASVREAAQHHAVTLPPTFDEAAARFHLKHRQNLAQAVRAGLTYKRCGREGLEAFYALHTRVRRGKHGLLPQGPSLFEHLCDVFFPDNGFILIAEHQGLPVSGMFFLACSDTLYYKFSASDLDALSARPNHFLISKAIELAIGDGYRRLDLGISDAEGLIRFKERIGGEASTVYAAGYNPLPKTAATTQMEKTLGDLTKLLTRPDIPEDVVQQGGELLYRYFT